MNKKNILFLYAALYLQPISATDKTGLTKPSKPSETVSVITNSLRLGPKASMTTIHENPIEIRITCCNHQCRNLEHERKREQLTSKLIALVQKRNCKDLINEKESRSNNVNNYSQSLQLLITTLKNEVANFNKSEACNLRMAFTIAATVTRSFRPEISIVHANF